MEIKGLLKEGNSIMDKKCKSCVYGNKGENRKIFLTNRPPCEYVIESSTCNKWFKDKEVMKQDLVNLNKGG